jgi:Dyp-type peroxidase family
VAPPRVSLQDGIYERDRPGRCYRLVLIDKAPQATMREAGRALALVWAMLQDLRAGTIDDLAPTPADDRRVATEAKLSALLAFGATLFHAHPELPPPRGVTRLDERGFPSLPPVAAEQRRPGEADFALQLIAESDLAVDRAVVEVWMLITAKKLPLALITYYSGFNRDDRRSWLGFHDGISNIPRAKRRQVIEVSAKEPPWMFGGTYMAFLRLALDLTAWRARSREDQEILVGREKLTGCALQAVDAQGDPVRLTGCPVGPSLSDESPHVLPPAPRVGETLLRRSHVHRSNPNRTTVDDESNRIFRQGYEFVEPAGDGQLRVGLNFVSFQNDLDRVTGILRSISWLGDANFGGVGTGHPGALALASLIGGGFYAVPPIASPFLGAEIF